MANLCHATHIVGGEVYYQYLNAAANGKGSVYKVSLRLFRDCNVPCKVNNVACLPEETKISVYQNVSGYPSAAYLTLPVEDTIQLTLTDYPPCISNKPSVCYEVHIYSTTVTLPDNDAGYILAYENCCRATTLNVKNDNAYSIQGLPGVTYDCTIPGKKILPDGHNSTAVFNLKKPDLVCYNTRFSLDYGATDPDAGDSVSFAFTPAYTSGETFQGADDEQSAEAPVYQDVTYNMSSGYTGFSPLGTGAAINPVTGQISGISPTKTGLYVVSVVVLEWRQGVNIASHRKDFILRVENCNIPEAKLAPSYITCNGFDLTFTNESNSANINSYYWDFGDPTTNADVSLSPVANWHYPAAGTYKVKLITNPGTSCSSTDSTYASVFPGFKVDFKYNGACISSPYVFTDASTTAYGVIDSWRWDFGDPTTKGDTARVKNPPPYKYSKGGNISVQLIATNSKGCKDTASYPITLVETPVIRLPFRDTLICDQDALQLSASTNLNSSATTYSWTPNTAITDANTPTPTVHPQTTTTYYLHVADGNNCTSDASVLVNVTDKVSLAMQPDTLICLTDTIQFHPVTNALHFNWTSDDEPVIDNTVKNAQAVPRKTTNYHLDANVGSCKNDGDVQVAIYPYPETDIQKIKPICLGTAVQLHASYNGTAFSWSPTSTLLNANTLDPTAGPSQTTKYYFTARDATPGHCPKPVTDTVTVIITPPITVFAGNDTNIVVGQELHLQASGARNYTWSPPTGMNKTNVSDPTVVLPESITRITYIVKGSTPEGCTDEDSLTVTQYKTMPSIFVPSAFTPNGDMINDIIKPIVAGIKKLETFSIYNRLGQLIYQTTTVGEGWDGIYKDKKQNAGTYVYEAIAIDYTGRRIVKKGTVVLIR